MRLLKFFSVFLITVIILFGFVLGWNWNSFTVFLDNREALTEGNEWIPKTSSLRGLSEFIGENPDNASVASMVVGYPDSLILFEENTPRIMGTISNFFVIAAYAIEIDRGNKNEQEMLNWDEISRYQLSNVEQSAHRESYREANRRGWIENNSISLKNALQLLAEYDDLTLADYLWWNLDQSIWNELSTMHIFENSDMPLPFSGLFLAISPGIQEVEVDEILNRWLEADLTDWRNHVITLSERYLYDSDDRDAFQSYLNRNRLGNTFMEERDAMQLFPKSTASEMLHVLEKIWNDDFINQQVSSMIRDFMRWPLTSQPNIELDFSDYGALYDNRLGLLNGINFGTSAYTGDTTVQAFFLDQLPIGFWFHASGGHMHQDFMQRLIYDPAMIDQMNQIVDQKK